MGEGQNLNTCGFDTRLFDLAMKRITELEQELIYARRAELANQKLIEECHGWKAQARDWEREARNRGWTDEPDYEEEASIETDRLETPREKWHRETQEETEAVNAAAETTAKELQEALEYGAHSRVSDAPRIIQILGRALQGCALDPWPHESAAKTLRGIQALQGVLRAGWIG